MDNYREGTTGPESPSNRSIRWTAGEDSSGLRHADFPRSPVESSDTFYQTQSRIGHREAPYLSSSSRIQPDMVDLMSATAPVQAPHAHFQNNLSISANTTHFPRTTSSSWPSPENIYGSPTAASSAPMTHHSQEAQGQQAVNDAYLHSSRTWGSHLVTSSHVPQGFQPNITLGDIGANPSGSTGWSSGAPVYSGQTHASAPAATFSMASNLPAGRSREHLRTRSFPTSGSWPTNFVHGHYQEAHNDRFTYTSGSDDPSILQTDAESSHRRGEDRRHHHQNR